MRQNVRGAAAAEPTSDATGNARQAALLGRLAIAGIILYVLLDVVAQLLPPHYSPIAQAESDLAVGPYGYIMTANFVLRGLLSLALLAGLVKGVAPEGRSRAGCILLGVWAVGAFLLALFPTDLAGARPTLHGMIHLVVALVAFISVAVGELLISLRLDRAGDRWRDLRTPALALAIVVLFALVIELVGFGSRSLFGLVERGFLGLALCWMLLVAWRLSALATSQAPAQA